MNYFLNFVFIFYIGATSGWILELIFRRIVHHKWVNPGFLIGPYLPIYGFGLVSLTVIYLLFNNLKIPSILVINPPIIKIIVDFINLFFIIKYMFINT